ncbi:MAG: hypothetical protein ABW217_15315 [Polyangiaceae bacterium]
MKTNHDEIELRELFIEELGEVTGGVSTVVWRGGKPPPITSMALGEEGPATPPVYSTMATGEEGPTPSPVDVEPAQDIGSFFRGINGVVQGG